MLSVLLIVMRTISLSNAYDGGFLKRLYAKRQSDADCQAAYRGPFSECLASVLDNAPGVFDLLKAGQSDEARQLIEDFQKITKSECGSEAGMYLMCCFMEGDCSLLQADWPELLEEGRQMLEDLKDVKVMDIMRMAAAPGSELSQ